jgi:hypothetical protein
MGEFAEPYSMEHRLPCPKPKAEDVLARRMAEFSKIFRMVIGRG